jgi:hypothetical protein
VILVIYFVTVLHKPLYFRVAALTRYTFSRGEIVDTMISTDGTLLLSDILKRINLKTHKFMHPKMPIASTYHGIYH